MQVKHVVAGKTPLGPVLLHRVHAVSKDRVNQDPRQTNTSDLTRNDELGSPSNKALRSRVCHTTTAPKASTKNSANVKTILSFPRSDRSAITLAPITNATMTVLIAVNTRPAVNNPAATIAILKVFVRSVISEMGKRETKSELRDHLHQLSKRLVVPCPSRRTKAMIMLIASNSRSDRLSEGE